MQRGRQKTFFSNSARLLTLFSEGEKAQTWRGAEADEPSHVPPSRRRPPPGGSCGREPSWLLAAAPSQHGRVPPSPPGSRGQPRVCPSRGGSATSVPAHQRLKPAPCEKNCLKWEIAQLFRDGETQRGHQSHSLFIFRKLAPGNSVSVASRIQVTVRLSLLSTWWCISAITS